MSTTLVTALFDLKRGELDGTFNRPFSQYLEHFEKLLKACKDTPMLVYVDPMHADFVRSAREGSVGTDIRLKTVDDLRTWFPFFDKVQTIRTSPSWVNQVGWLGSSTQAKLEMYNPLVMSKMFMLHDAMLLNSFDTDHYCWIDAGLTHTVHPGYFSHDAVIQKVESMMDKFLFVCFPYIGADEIHGFKRSGMNAYAGVGCVDRVARGGFFGGHKSTITQMNELYYDLLNRTLSDGYMGTEESVFTLMTYLRPEFIRVEMIDANGLIQTFFERVKRIEVKTREIVVPAAPERVPYTQSVGEIGMNELGKGTALYIVTFNSPPQLQLLFDSFTASNPELLNTDGRFLIDNSVDVTTAPKYDEIARKYGFTIIRHGNMGICGARQWAAQHFHDGPHRYLVWFEDDMLLESKVRLCKNGLNMHVPDFLHKCIKIVEREHFDFLKFSFSEFYGDHHKQWSWHNVPADVRRKYFPDGTCRMQWGTSGCVDGLSFLEGSVFYSNWPSLMTRAGNYKIFLETKYAHMFEQTAMSECFQKMMKGRIRSGVLMSSLINHSRTFHYSAEIRKEC